jgi:hypothetical protein
MKTVRIYGGLEARGGGLSLSTVAGGDFPPNPQPVTLWPKDGFLYAYMNIGGLLAWRPLIKISTQCHLHTQGEPAAKWTIRHGLKTRKLWMQVLDETGNVLGVGKTDVDDDMFELEFPEPYTGSCVVVSPDLVDVPEVKADVIDIAGRVRIDSTGVRIGGEYLLTADQIKALLDPRFQLLSDTLAGKADKNGAALIDPIIQGGGYRRFDAKNNPALNYANGCSQRLAPAAGQPCQISVSGWPEPGVTGFLFIELIGGGAATLIGSGIRWRKSDNTVTANFGDLGVALSTNGSDFLTLWTSDGGATVWGRVG